MNILRMAYKIDNDDTIYTEGIEEALGGEITRLSLECKTKTDEEELRENIFNLLDTLKMFVEKDRQLRRFDEKRENTEEENAQIQQILPDDGFSFEGFLNKYICDNTNVPDSIRLAVQIKFNL